MNSSATNPDMGLNQGLVDDNIQIIPDISNGALYTAGILDGSAANGAFLAGLSVQDPLNVDNYGDAAGDPLNVNDYGDAVEDPDADEYRDAMAAEDYEFPYPDVLSSANVIESISLRKGISSANQSFDTVSEADMAALGSSSPVCFNSSAPHRSEGDSFLSEGEGASTPRPVRQQEVSKWHIVDHVRDSHEKDWLKDPTVTFICRTIKKKANLVPKPWQVDAMINVIHEKKDVVVSAGTGSGKSLPYTLIPLIKPSAIVLVLSPTIALMNDQV